MTVLTVDLLVIAAAVVLAPLLARGAARWVRVPIVVFELVLGILIGPSVLGLAKPEPFVDLLAEFGLAMLFFVAGSEINFIAINGRPITRAAWGWLISLVGGIALGMLFSPGAAAVFIGISLSSTALGTLLPILRDAKELPTPFGRAVTAIGAVGEFGPLVAISLFLGADGFGISTIVLGVFLAIAAGGIFLAMRVPHGRLHSFVSSSLHTSGQFAVRVIILILVALVVVSIVLNLDMLLGAFAAGVIWQLLMRNAAESDRHLVDTKVEGLAFGFLVPIFFVYTGVTFDLESLLADWRVAVLVPIFLVALLVVRGLPSTLAAPVDATVRDRVSIGLLGATGLPIIVAVTAIGVDAGAITSGLAAALVGAGMLSVLIYPLVGMAVRGEANVPVGAEL